jgi:hypothetical protein
MTSLVLGDLILESLTPSVNAPLVKFSLIYLQVWFIKSYTFISATDSLLFDLVPWPLSLHTYSQMRALPESRPHLVALLSSCAGP